MKTKTTFNLNSEDVTNGFQKAFDWIQSTKVSIASKSGKEYVNIPLIITIVVALLVPFALIIGLVIGLALSLNISFQREVQDNKTQNDNVIDIK